MNNIDKITERILSDARQEIREMQQENKGRCEEILTAGKTEAQEEYGRIFKKGANDAALRVERLNSMAQLEAKKQILREKQSLIGEAFDRALSMIRNLPDQEYSKFVALLAAEASVTGSEQIILSENDRNKYGISIVRRANSILRERAQESALSLSKETREITGGVILTDGSVELNCSLEMLIGGRKEDLSTEVAAVLFE